MKMFHALKVNTTYEKLFQTFNINAQFDRVNVKFKSRTV